MNLQPQVLSLTISVMSLLDATLFTTALAAQAEINHNSTSTHHIAQASPSAIERTWQAEENKFQVKLFQEHNVLKGKIVGLPPGAETKDVKNPDPKLRSRNLIGVVMFNGFTYNPRQKIWAGGTVYIPDLGRTMKPKLWLEGDRVKMQISMGFMNKTVTLTAME
jgi:Uncharacterized protein conserved in bacteria (DUF2147)